MIIYKILQQPPLPYSHLSSNPNPNPNSQPQPKPQPKIPIMPQNGFSSAEKNYNQTMRPNNLFLAELYVGKCKIAQPIPQKIYLTFRIGKNMAQSTLTRIAKDGEIDIDATLQLNTDKLALDTQRSSLTLSSIGNNNQITVLGMVLITLPRQTSELSKKYKLAQCLDKTAEIDLCISIKSLDSPSPSSPKKFSISLSSEVSSKGSIMEMQQFDKKTISPPRLFNNQSQKQIKMLPPKPKSSKDINHQSEELRESVSRLEYQCEGLKELLKTEFRKREEADKLIDCLVSTLQEINQSEINNNHDLDETLLLQGIDKDDSHDKIQQRNIYLQKQIVKLNAIIDQLRLENKHLSGSLQKTNDSTKLNSRQVIQSAKELGKYQENYIGDSNKKMDRITFEVHQLEAEIFEKFEEMEKYKKKLKIATKLPTLQTAPFERVGNSIASIRSLVQHFINENKQMTKILLKYLKHEADSQSEGFITKIRQKIDKTFGSLISKKMNRDIILFEKGQLLKAIQQQWQKGP